MWSAGATLLIPIVALIFLAVMIDKLTMAIDLWVHKTDWMPEKIEDYVAYGIIWCIGFICCWRGHYSLFTYLDFKFAYEFEGWIMTAFVLSGGSAYLKKNFDVMENMPGFLSSMYGTARRVITGSSPVLPTEGTVQSQTTVTTPTGVTVTTNIQEGRDSL